MFTELLSSADPKSITAFALIALMFVATFLLLRPLLRFRKRKPEHRPEHWVLIDGSNVMHWQDNTPQLAPVRGVIAAVQALGYFPGVVFDANAGWKLQGKYLHDGDFARLLGLEKRQVLVVEKGTQADPFLLQTALEFDARIVTNDRFRDWVASYPKVSETGFLIRGGMQGGKVWLGGLAATSTPAVLASVEG